MILPAAGTLISQSQVMGALNFSGTPQTNISLLYSSSVITASTATTLNSLMYHNLFMGSGASQTAKQAIYDTFNSGNTFKFLNWGDYNSDPNIRLTWTITNNNIDNIVNGNIYIYYEEGNANGPYNVYLSGSSGLTVYGLGVTQAQMEAGYVISLPSGFTSSSVVIYNMAYGCSTEDNVPFPTKYWLAFVLSTSQYPSWYMMISPTSGTTFASTRSSKKNLNSISHAKSTPNSSTVRVCASLDIRALNSTGSL